MKRSFLLFVLNERRMVVVLKFIFTRRRHIKVWLFRRALLELAFT
jgi:hypothetical protein